MDMTFGVFDTYSGLRIEFCHENNEGERSPWLIDEIARCFSPLG